MLISFAVENFRSFADEQVLTLVADKDTSHRDHVVEFKDFGLLKSAVLYGANASGKSNLVKAVGFMERFVVTSATRMNLGDPIVGAESFRLDATRAGRPCSFEVRLLLDSTEFQYGFSATIERVYDESLYVKRGGSRFSNPLRRTFDPETGKTQWQVRGELKEAAQEVINKTRDNGLFLSRAAEMNVEFVKDLFLWFKSRLWQFDLASPRFPWNERTARRIESDPGFRSRVERLIHDADFGIDGLSATEEVVRPPEDAPKEVHELVRALGKAVRLGTPEDVTAEVGFKRHAVRARHKLLDSEETVEFPLQDESNGTRRFFALIGPVLDALDKGHVLLVDELDCSMHPLLTRRLIELFHSPEANPQGAQLVFTTHDSTLMDRSLFRRDQIWITEKDRKGATELFSLADVRGGRRPRKSEAFEKNYLSGRYGGVPSFGPALEDLEVR